MQQVDSGVYYSQTGDPVFMVYEDRQVQKTLKIMVCEDQQFQQTSKFMVIDIKPVVVKIDNFTKNIDYTICTKRYCPYCRN